MDNDPRPLTPAELAQIEADGEALNEFEADYARFSAMPSHVLGRHVQRLDGTAILVAEERGLPAVRRLYESPAPTPAPADGLLTTAQAAALLGCSARSVTRAVRRGALRAVRVGGLVRFRRSDLEKLGR